MLRELGEVFEKRREQIHNEQDALMEELTAMVTDPMLFDVTIFVPSNAPMPSGNSRSEDLIDAFLSAWCNYKDAIKKLSGGKATFSGTRLKICIKVGDGFKPLPVTEALRDALKELTDEGN